jgi:hypothetical protein
MNISADPDLVPGDRVRFGEGMRVLREMRRAIGSSAPYRRFLIGG